MCYHAGPEWIWEQWQWRGAPYSPRPQHYWDLTIRLFSVISRTLVVGEGVLPRCREAVGVFYSPSRLSKILFDLMWLLSQFCNFHRFQCLLGSIKWWIMFGLSILFSSFRNFSINRFSNFFMCLFCWYRNDNEILFVSFQDMGEC